MEYAVPPARGRIEVICGCMFSGKTEELIRRLRRAEFAKQKIQVFKPALDNRYGITEIVTHQGLSAPCVRVHCAEQIMLFYNNNSQVVGIDEAQFFDEGIVDVCNKLANRGIRVIVAGLDMDYTGKPFGPMPHLLAVAEFVTKLHAICTETGQPAFYSYRIADSEEKVLLGEKNEYQPLSRDAFFSATRVKNLTPASSA